ncbi:unnamed protein product [Arabidopsis arenosa]|uniref:WEB family protein n=1 Tax=Arabidopsis arenosa TaxID=38785 RepID=A0A8S2B0E0_ARAAE|nr:unnamed protein product [Arabidopsis arenosa]
MGVESVLNLSELFMLVCGIESKDSQKNGDDGLTGLMETPRSKPSPPTPRVSKPTGTKSDGNSPSPVHSTRLSPQTVTSKLATDRRTARVPTPPEASKTNSIYLNKSQSRLGKGTELLAQLNQIQEDFRKANEEIERLKKDKSKALDDLKESEKLTKEANEKLREALAAQQRAEKSSEIEIFRAVELEQAGIEAVHKKEISWKKEVESIRSQHALDISALLSTTEELHRIKQELAMTADAKNKALSHAEEATKIAENQAEKAEILSSELSRLKALVSLDERKNTIEGDEVVSKLKSELEMLRGKLEKVSILENTLKGQEESIELLHVDLEAAKMVESYANNLAAEWKSENLLNEKTELATELENCKKEEEKSKKAMEGLTLDLQEVSAEAREAKEKLLTCQAELELSGTQIESLKLAEKDTNEKHGKMLEDARNEIDGLKSSLENTENEFVNSKTEWEQRELRLTICVKKLENEIFSVQEELSKVKDLLNLKEVEACAVKEEEAKMKSNRKELEEEIKDLQERVEEAEAESMKLKESLLEKEDELKNAAAENQKLREMEVSSVEKIDELSKVNESLLDKETKLQNIIQEAEELRVKEIDYLKKIEELSATKESLVEKETKLLSIVQEAEELRRRELACLKTIEEFSAVNERLVDKEAKLQSSIQEIEVLKEREAEYIKQIEELSLLNESLVEKEAKLQTIVQENEELREKESAYHKKIEELSRVNEIFADRETELQSSTQENEELREREVASLKKIEELAKLQENLLGKENELHDMVLEIEDLKAKDSLAEKKIEELSNINKSLLVKESELQDVVCENEELKSKEAKKIEELSKMKECLLDKETELQTVIHDNDELKAREAFALKKIEELSKLLEEASSTDEKAEENGKLSDIQKGVGFSQENDPRCREEITNTNLSDHGTGEQKVQESPLEAIDRHLKDDTTIHWLAHNVQVIGKGDKDKDSMEGEGYHLEKREASSEHDFAEEEVDSKAEGSENFDQLSNGLSSAEHTEDLVSKEQHQKKKKPLLRKFGNLLKKKSTSSSSKK